MFFEKIDFNDNNERVLCQIGGKHADMNMNIKVKKFSVRELLMGTGGMPSSHTTAVVALACACGIQCSVASVEFAMSVVFALITMQEAVGTRRQVGEHSKALNHIFDELAAANNDPTLTQKALNELVGHTPLQVLVGAILGIIIPFLVKLIPVFNV